MTSNEPSAKVFQVENMLKAAMQKTMMTSLIKKTKRLTESLWSDDRIGMINPLIHITYKNKSVFFLPFAQILIN